MLKLSVVVPVYNDALHVKNCIESLINQSLKDIQILIINDASTDGTNQVIKDYQEQYSNIIVYNHDTNMGTGEARNTGLKYANSQYIAFLDSDDWLDSNTYINIIRELENDNSDIAICGIKTEFESPYNSILRYNYPCKNVISGNFALKLLCSINSQDIYISSLVGNKVFNRDFLINNNIKFPQLSLFEDDYFMFISLLCAKNISIVPKVFHHYYQRESSAMHTMSKTQIDCFIKVFKEIRDYLIINKIFENKSKEYYSFLDKCLSSLLNIIFSCEQKLSMQQKYLIYLAEEMLGIFTIKELLENIEPSRISRIWQYKQ